MSLWLLFSAALLAATIIPAQSELVLLAMASEAAHPLWLLLLVASVGNILGSCLNWLLGRYLARWRTSRYFPLSEAQWQGAVSRYQRYGIWSLLFAWLPFIGDPLTVIAGALRAPFWLFLLLVSIGKVARYAVLLGLIA